MLTGPNGLDLMRLDAVRSVGRAAAPGTGTRRARRRRRRRRRGRGRRTRSRPAAQRPGSPAHLLALLEAGQRAHPDALVGGVADADLARAGPRSPRRRASAIASGHEGPADRGALLAGLDRHLGDELLDEQVELRVPGADVGAEDRAVERVGLGVEAGRRRAATMGGCAASRRCAAEPVNATEVLLGRGGRTGCRRCRRPAAASPRAACRTRSISSTDELGQVGGLAGRLDHARHPGEERRRELLQHAPRPGS